ncbi:MAG: FtsQ-type POTRA domain-containing protein [Nitrospirota bacterium]
MKANRQKTEDRRQKTEVRKKNNRSIFWKITAVFLLLAVLAIAVYISSGIIKSVFPIKRIVFIGNKHLTDDELKTLTGINCNENNPPPPPFSKGGKGGLSCESLVTISNREVSKRLLKSPWIRSVSVRKEFPETLSVAIDETVSFALLDMDGHLFLIDEKGRLLEELKDNPIPFLPIITGDPFKEGEGFSDALNLARLMKDKGFSSERNHIEIIAFKPQDLTVIIDETVVKVGSGGYEEKLERLIELEDEIKRREIPVDYIDLRFANRVIVKPVTEVIK